MVEGENDFDEVGLEDAGDVEVLDLVEDVQPCVAGGEEEGELRKVEVGGVGDGDGGDVELEDAGVCESEFVKGDYGSCVGSDSGLADLGSDGSNKEEDWEEEDQFRN